jgi:hypothetical protein
MMGLMGLVGLLVGCVSGETGSEEPFLWVITTEGAGDEVKMVLEGETAVLDIHSETGIGGAQVQLQSGTWPPEMVLRFHLSGLEEMTLIYGETTLTLNVSSHGDNAIWQSITQNGNTEEIGPDSPYWMNVSLTAADGSPASIPLDKGTIQVTIPKDITQSDQTSFTIQWIDFYR